MTREPESTPTQEPTEPTRTPAPTAEPTPTPESTPEPTAAPTPTDTPTKTPKATSTPKPARTHKPTLRRTPPPVKPVKLRLRKVADGFENANGLFNAGDDRLFVTEQLGYVYLLKPKDNGTYKRSGTFLDIHERVACCGEKGLLGLAFPPDFKKSGKFYVTYAGTGHTWNLDERRISKHNPDRADPDWRRSLIRIYKPHEYHWGGNMYFGPDGYLWVAMGDGGFGGGNDDPGDPDNRAQDLSQIFGKMLRIDPHDPDGKGRRKYTIPDDNPFVKKRGAAPEIWAYGLRNPWRWSFDRLTGDLWLTDVGMHRYEEVDRAKAPSRGKGANYGWRLMEGPACYNPPSGCSSGVTIKKPIATYRHENTSAGFACAVTGGFVYRGKAFPALRSWYVFGDYCSGAIFLLDSGGDNSQRPRLGLDTDYMISSMGVDKDGEIYVIDYGKTDAIYRLEGSRAN